MTDAERERLAMLAEECAEVIQVVGKILRHGYNSYHPDDPKVTNRELLIRELQDIEGVVYGMREKNDIDPPIISADPEITWNKKLKWSHYQGDINASN